MDYIEISAKTVDDCITDACEQFTVTSDKLDYEVISEGSTGFLGLKVKPAVIRVKIKSDESEAVQEEKTISLEEQIDKKLQEKEQKKSSKKESAPKKEEKVEEVAPVEEVKEISYVYDHEFINRAKEFSANVFGAMNMKVDVIESEEGPGYGGAILAAVACGEYASVEEAASKLVKVIDTVEPDPVIAARYEEQYRKFVKMYPALKDTYSEI